MDGDEIGIESDEQLGGLKWMLDIGLATLADLCSVSLTSKYIGIPDSVLDYVSFIFSEVPHHRIDDLIR